MGEGHFGMSIKARGNTINVMPRFCINLRADDQKILDWLKVYFGCGKVDYNVIRKSKKGVAHPQCRFHVECLYNLHAKIIPHFDKYPLRAKKKDDYILWKDMVLYSSVRYRLSWSDEDKLKLCAMYSALKEIRKYKEALIK